eukprot:TRINITY_DN4173_c0_g1_i1.p1 TRINITY_DN4173_c0_g1~~TRINITY_DN4173_c0_g1_i1.p1  ORF type:complete len:586 (-),score=221.07 TRINITY_DN4173_c0_g1_i1:325-2025(-)
MVVSFAAFALLGLSAIAAGHVTMVSPLERINMRNLQSEASSTTLVASPLVLENNGDWVNVVFSSDQPQADDIVAVFTPSTVQLNETSPVKYQYANMSETYLSTGKGQLQFRLVNMHDDYVFVMLRNESRPTVFGRSNAVAFRNPAQPMQGHISLTGKPSEMRVSWQNAIDQVEQMIQWGFSSGSYSNWAQSQFDTYAPSDLCGSPARDYGWHEPGLLHTYVITGLQAGQQVFYQFGSKDNWSPEYSFMAPKPASAAAEVFIAAYGDMGKGEVDGSLEHWEELPALNTTKNVYALVEQLDLVLHIGDIAYAVGYSTQWDEFMDEIQPTAARVPYMVGIGNHERDYEETGPWTGKDSGGECGVPYEHRFLMPRVDGQGEDQPWYSFDLGPVHVVVMSTEHDFNVSSAQYAFLARDLSSVNRSVTPWLIFSGHRPMYIDSNNTVGQAADQPVAQQMRDNLEPLLYQNQVNLALWGHHHSYQRSCPVYRQQCIAPSSPTAYAAPVHVVIGMAGMGLTQNLEVQPPSWLQIADDQEWGYSTIYANATALHMQFFSNVAGLRDDFWLYQAAS